jgi:short-subunit dehydrogenase
MKRAIIIGATSGIGRTLAELLVREDYLVGITGRREELLQSIQAENPGKIFVKKMDVQDISTIGFVCNELVCRLEGLDLLIICAGIGEENKELDFETDNDVIRTNIQGFTYLCNWGMRFFKNQGYGHIVNISSVAGLRGNGLAPSYSATKAYQINYLESLRLNTYKFNLPIYVTDVRPGFVDTAMAKGDGLFWVAPVEKAAKQIYRAIRHRVKVVYISKRWRLIGYILKYIPYSILKRF